MSNRKIATLAESNDFRVRSVMARLGSEVALMEAQGYSVQEREDHVFRSLSDLERSSMNENISQYAQVGGFDLLRGVKRGFAERIADSLQIQQGFIRDVIVNFAAGLTLADLKAFVTPGACKSVVAKLAGALQGALADYILKSIGLPPENFLSRAVVEALKSGFVESGPFVRIASDTICNIKISDLLPGGTGLSVLFGGDKNATAQAGATAQAAGADVTAPAV